MSNWYGNSERKLVKYCLAGKAEAQRTLYDQYVDAIYHTALRMCGRTDEAEDITQDTFILVFRQLDTFKGESSLGAWIKRIGVNTALNYLRKKRPQVAFDQLPEAATPPRQPDEEAEQSYNVRRIHQAIQTLPEGGRVILSLHLLEGYQHKEIAQILGISESTSKSQYHRARKLLQKKLKTRCPRHPGIL